MNIVLKILVVLTVAVGIVGCAKKVDNHSDRQVAQEVIDNRKLYRKEIAALTVECLKEARSATHITAASNDQAETVAECRRSAQIVYGAYSDYSAEYLYRLAGG